MIHLDLAVPTDWTRIDQVREAVGHSVAAVFGDLELKDALAMVSAELLENALKYGRPAQGDVRISLRDDAGRLVVTVTNEVDEGSEHARLLDELVRWVREADSPLAAYEAALARTISDETEALRSGLGLARISYEGGCDLDCDTSEPGRVTVRAVTR